MIGQVHGRLQEQRGLRSKQNVGYSHVWWNHQLYEYLGGVVQGQVWRIRRSEVSCDCNRQNQKAKFETYWVEQREQWKEMHYQPYEQLEL